MVDSSNSTVILCFMSLAQCCWRLKSNGRANGVQNAALAPAAMLFLRATYGLTVARHHFVPVCRSCDDICGSARCANQGNVVAGLHEVSWWLMFVSADLVLNGRPLLRIDAGLDDLNRQISGIIIFKRRPNQALRTADQAIATSCINRRLKSFNTISSREEPYGSSCAPDCGDPWSVSPVSPKLKRHASAASC